MRLLSRIQVTSHVIRLQSILPLRRIGAALAVVAVLGASSGCVYRINIQQGNFLEKRNTDQLATGMTKVQVRYLLGTPMVPTIFDNDRWDYLYYLKIARQRPIQRQLTVYFKDDKVDKVPRRSRRMRRRAASRRLRFEGLML
jgi:outer membrane protein assembly factor BamE